MRHDHLPRQAVIFRGLGILVWAVELMLAISFVLGTGAFLAWIVTTGGH